MALLRIQPVQSLDGPELALYRTLRRVEEHERAGVLVAANHKVIRRLLASRYTVVSALLTPAWLQKMDIFALSSDTEQMPLSVLEAMGCGLPVVSTDVGDVRRMLAPANAPFVVPRDADAMASALRELLDLPEARRAIGAANRARAVEAFDQRTMFAAYAELFG